MEHPGEVKMKTYCLGPLSNDQQTKNTPASNISLSPTLFERKGRLNTKHASKSGGERGVSGEGTARELERRTKGQATLSLQPSPLLPHCSESPPTSNPESKIV